MKILSEREYYSRRNKVLKNMIKDNKDFSIGDADQYMSEFDIIFIPNLNIMGENLLDDFNYALNNLDSEDKIKLNKSADIIRNEREYIDFYYKSLVLTFDKENQSIQSGVEFFTGYFEGYDEEICVNMDTFKKGRKEDYGVFYL